MLFDFNNTDLCEHLNKYIEIDDILKLRQTYKKNNTFKILKSHNFMRNIKFGTEYYINKIDKYHINIIIYDNYKVFNKCDLNILDLYKQINIHIVKSKTILSDLMDNYRLLDLIYNLLVSNKINILYVDINIFYILCNYFKTHKNNLYLNTLHIKMGECYDKFLYWDLTLYNLKQCLKYFKKCKNLIFGNVIVCSIYLNLLKKHNIMNNIEIVENIDDYYLKKNDIKIKIVINSLNINNQDINYNMYFNCEEELLINRHSIGICF